jgi:hypothetical protein
MVIIHNKEEKEAFNAMGIEVACMVHAESTKFIKDIKDATTIDVAFTTKMGEVIGDTVLERVEETLKGMDNKSLTRWYTQAIVAYAILRMNHSKEFRDAVHIRNMLKG